MDKNTLSNYGWIVIAVLVLSVMIALATPFGQYVENAVWSATEGVFETEDAALGKVLDDMGIVPSVNELQAKHKFDYYSTFRGAVADVNANTIGVNADATKDSATAGIYTDNGETYVVLLKDATETSRITTISDMTLNLGGNTLSFNNSSVGIDTDNSGKTIIIDGRINGSKISVVGDGSNNAYALQVKPNDSVIVNNVDIKAVSNSAAAYACSIAGSLTLNNSVIRTETMSGISSQSYAILSRANSNININNSEINSSSVGFASGIYNFTKEITIKNSIINCTANSNNDNYGVLNYNDSGITIIDSVIKSENKIGKSYGVYNSDDTIITVNNSSIKAYSNYDRVNNILSIGISNYGSSTIENCYIYGTHSGVQNSGDLYINGGTYEGYGHGGVYCVTNSNENYIENAILREATMPAGYSASETSIDADAGMYIGGSENANNISVYVNNCDIYGSRQPIVLRGISGEKNNALYISNSRINLGTVTGIRIDSDTHKLYLGKSNNFTANDTTLPTSVVITNETYCQ